jgi:hypothetical protein
LAFAQQLASNRPVVAIMLVDQNLRCALFKFEDLRHHFGDGSRKTPALF